MKPYKIITIIAAFFLSICYIQGQSSTLAEVSPDGRYQLFLNEKNIDNNSRYFESYLLDLQSGARITLAKNYKNDALSPNWFWDKHSQYLIFEGNEYGAVAKIQVWDLEDSFLLYELKGSIPIARAEAASFWDSENEVLTFLNMENIEMPQSLVLDLKTRKVRKVVVSLDDLAVAKE